MFVFATFLLAVVSRGERHLLGLLPSWAMRYEA